MLQFLSKQIPYKNDIRKQFLISAALGLIVAFIMVFLEPFGTYQFESNYKYLIFSGFGFLFALSYLINTRLENLWYDQNNKKWVIKQEIVSFLSFLFISNIIIHFYNQVFLNNLFDYEFDGYEYVKHGIWFFGHVMIPVILLLLPFYIYFRNKFGELNTSERLSETALYGLNKGEKIRIQKAALLFVKASENYVEIFHSKDNTIRHETFRNTLSAINTQAPFLCQCHRSYLVNLTAIKTVKGNSQNAKIEFYHDDLGIPISKSYYNSIKSALSI